MVLTRMMDIIGIDVVGTVKTNRKGQPQECKFPKKGRNMKTKEGEMKCMEASMTLSNGTFGPVYMVLAWMDSKPVHLLSIFPPLQVAMRRLQPSTIPVYNSAMCGTDLEDQNASYYDARKRVWRWQHRLSTTYPLSTYPKTLYHCAQLPANKMTLLKFKMQLILDWCTPETPSDNYDADDGSDDDGFSGDEQDLWAPTSKWHEFDCHLCPQYRKTYYSTGWDAKI